MRIDCPHFHLCSGCSRNEDVEHPKAFSEAFQFFEKQGLPPLQLHCGNALRWRCRAKLAVRGSWSSPQIGLFEEGSHKVVDIPFCQVHHPLINQAVSLLRAWIIEHRIALYDEVSGSGLLRYLQLTVERVSQKVQLVLVLNSLSQCILENEIRKLWDAAPTLWHSVWGNFNSRRDNVILGPEWRLFFGREFLVDEYHNTKVCFHPSSFMQANPEMFEKLLGRLHAFVPADSRLIEFYAGVGSIGLTLVDRCRSIQCIEIAPYAQECFEEACRMMPERMSNKISFVHGAAEKHTALLEQPFDIAIVDPPRKGLNTVLLNALCASTTLKRLIYVSCGWEALQRDCQRLISKGWKLHAAEAFLFFPGSDQIELLCVFDRP